MSLASTPPRLTFDELGVADSPVHVVRSWDPWEHADRWLDELPELRARWASEDAREPDEGLHCHEHDAPAKACGCDVLAAFRTPADFDPDATGVARG